MCYGSIEYLILSTLYQFCLQIKSLVYGILVPTKGNFKMASFLVFFEVSGPAVAVHSQKKWLSQCRGTILRFELLFLVVTATLIKIEYQKCFCKVFYGASKHEDEWNGSDQLLSPQKTIVDSCALYKMLLVYFCHSHRAFLSLPQFSSSTNTGCSRALFSCLSLGHQTRTIV